MKKLLLILSFIPAMCFGQQHALFKGPTTIDSFNLTVWTRQLIAPDTVACNRFFDSANSVALVGGAWYYNDGDGWRAVSASSGGITWADTLTDIGTKTDISSLGADLLTVIADSSQAYHAWAYATFLTSFTETDPLSPHKTDSNTHGNPVTLDYANLHYLATAPAITLTGDVTGTGTTSIATTIGSGRVTNSKLANSTITINSTPTSLGGSINVGTVTDITFTSPLTGGVINSFGTVSIPAATSIVNGYLSSPDWTTFNSKITSFTATSPLTGGVVANGGSVGLGTTGTAGTYGSATTVPVFTTDAFGRVSGVTTATATPAWISVTGTPITIAGYGITDAVSNTLSLTINGTTQTLAANRTWSVGTVTSVSAGDLPPLFTAVVGTSTTTPALSYSLTAASAYKIFGNNTASSAVPAYFTPALASALFSNQGTSTALLHGNAAGNPSWSAVSLTADVTGVLAEANGGTNQSSYATGDMIYASATNTLSKLTGNTTTTKKFYTQTGNGTVSAAPGWNTIVAGDIPDVSSTYVTWSVANTQTGTTYTLVAGDRGKIVAFTNSSAVTVTVPQSLGSTFYCTVQQDGTGQVTLSAGSGVTLHNRQSYTKTAGQYAQCSILFTNTADTYNTQGDMQ